MFINFCILVPIASKGNMSMWHLYHFLILLDFICLRVLQVTCSITISPFTQGTYFQRRLIYKVFLQKQGRIVKCEATEPSHWAVRPRTPRGEFRSFCKHLDLKRKKKHYRRSWVTFHVLIPTLSPTNSLTVEKYSQKFRCLPSLQLWCLEQCQAHGKCSVNVLETLPHIYLKYYLVL